MDFDVTFADGTFGCSTKRMVTISCTWDVTGSDAVRTLRIRDSADLSVNDSAGNRNIGNYAKCTAS